MAETRLAVDDFEKARWPQVCVLTGRTDEVGELSIRATNPIGAAWALLLLGVIPLVIYRAVTRRVAVGSLPLSNAAYEHLQVRRGERKRRFFKTVGAVTGVLVLVSLATSPPGAISFGLLGGLIALLFKPDEHWTPCRVQLEESGRWVRLAEVDPAFADAVEKSTRRAKPESRQPAEPTGTALSQPVAPSGSPTVQPPGWYADPISPGRNRYWDGTGWTDSVADR